MNHSDGRGDIVDFASRDRPIDDADIVLWHVFGLHHLPRTEDFPGAAGDVHRLQAPPSGFHDQNPAIDLPPEVNAASRLAGSSCCD
jgi:primary-amine oxidase